MPCQIKRPLDVLLPLIGRWFSESMTGGTQANPAVEVYPQTPTLLIHECLLWVVNSRSMVWPGPGPTRGLERQASAKSIGNLVDVYLQVLGKLLVHEQGETVQRRCLRYILKHRLC